MVLKELKRKNLGEAGFTLAEMLIVVAVVVIVTTIVLSNNSKFGGTVLLQNLAYDIALSTREAQVYSISVRNFGSSFTTPFGVHYDLTSPMVYTVFGDANGNGHYDTGEIVQSTTITRGYYIGQLCVTPVGGSQDCTVQQLDIVYKHPEPDAYIRSNVGDIATLYGRGRVKVMSPRADEMCIYTDLNGQISVRNCT